MSWKLDVRCWKKKPKLAKTKPFAVAAIVLFVGASFADDWDASGEVGIETRVFTQDARFGGQSDGVGLSFMLQPEFRRKSTDKNNQFSVIPFYRYDSDDSERTHFDLREAYWLHLGEQWEVLSGVNKVFWGVAESRHLVDIINQTDQIEDIDQEDKLGQPMVSATSQRDWGAVTLFWLPYFRERTFPGSEGRLRSPLPVDSGNAKYESGAEQWHQDFAVRYSHYIGDWDIGASYFRGTGREPRLLPGGNGQYLIAYYDIIDQMGIDLQYTYDAWLWKFEGITRKGQGKTFFAAVGGFEYTFYQVAESASDIGVLLEYQYDGRDDSAPFTLADNDVFAGVRWSLNDIQDTALLAGVAFDHQTGERFFNVEAERRIGNHFTAELRVRFFSGASPGEASFSVARDDYLQLALSYHF